MNIDYATLCDVHMITKCLLKYFLLSYYSLLFFSSCKAQDKTARLYGTPNKHHNIPKKIELFEILISIHRIHMKVFFKSMSDDFIALYDVDI